MPIKTRKQLIADWKHIRDECQQILIDCEHWNKHVRKPGDAPIDADPDGWLAVTIKRMDEMIQRPDEFLNREREP